MQGDLGSGSSDEATRARNGWPEKRWRVLTLVTLSGLLALAGCAGGGGGGGPASALIPALTYQYPSSLSTATPADPIGGAIAPYALDPTSTPPQLASIPPAVLGASAGSGKLTITVSNIPLPSGVNEPSFVVTFDPTSGSPLSTGPLDGIGCSGCFMTTTAPATSVSDGKPAGTVTFTYLNPSSKTFPLKYSTLGIWTKPTTVSGAGAWTEVGAAFSAGVVTRGIDLPTTGTASYSGFFIGRYSNSDSTTPGLPPAGIYQVGANAQAQVNFGGKGAVMFSTSHTQISGGGLLAPTPEPNLDLSTNTPMTINRTVTSNSFAGGSGTLTNALHMGDSGQIAGSFYGPPAATAPYAPSEMGGSLAVSNASKTQEMVGSFALKK